MSAKRILLSLILLVGLAACESDTPDPVADPGQIDQALSEFASARSQVIQSLGEARGADLSESAALDRAAARHALDLATHRTSTHIGLDGSSPGERIASHGGQMDRQREFIFRIEGDPGDQSDYADLADRALATWLAPLPDNAVLTESATHAAVAFAPTRDGGYVGVLLLAQR
ncbi:hypothetical protein DRQ53_13455 [bacterium]|nr:MAG: hypothetical protein DRQ53_13455 [bacterium]RKZ13932.1 MAG: hypothetical protein DRQ32_00505 [bacterium]